MVAMGAQLVWCLIIGLLVHASAENCKPSSCFSSNKTPHFAPKTGQQYNYEFESIATAQLLNKDSVETSVTIKGVAQVIAGDNCGHTLALKNVIVLGPDNTKQVVKELQAQPVQFTLSGDELATEICADNNDGAFSVNVKRGIISALQNGADKSTETDIFGKCPISSSSSTSGATTTVTSSRDLDKCAYREKLTNGIIQAVATETSDIKSAPLLNGHVDSEAKFQNGVLQSVELKETYKFLPFSTQEHGARAKVTTKLTLKNTAEGKAPTIKTPVLRTILFENTNQNLASPKVKESLKSAFGKTLQEFTGQEGGISAKSAASFAEIIRLMRLAKKNDLLNLYNEMKKGTLSEQQKSTNMKAISRAIFLDALYRTGTGDSVSALADLSKKEFNEKEQKLMYLSFNLVQSVNKDAINSLAKLFTENLPKEAYLSIGSVINKYCRDRGCEASEIKPIADKFISKIPKNCKAADKKEEEQLVSVLKGIRNSHTILNAALDRIIQCANDKNPNRVRVAALQAFTANPCNKKLQQSAITVMKNREEDSEVRIEAYLAAMECPSGNLANEVQSMLDSEPINQVGSFVNTHLDSVRASTDPKRESTRAHFRNLRTNKKFPFDPRRYSFNREVSYAIDSIGLGSSVDGSIIYSQQSWLPRSVRMNVTGNLFGSAFNIFELAARQDNLEHLIEHYFGPQGVFPRMSKQELFDIIKREVTGLSRQKRALPGDLAAFDRNVKTSSEFDRDSDIDLSLKVFGSELYFLSMSQSIPSTPSEFMKVLAKEFYNGIDGLKDFNLNFENHGLFCPWIDSEIVYPTAFGLPLKLTGSGAVTVKVGLGGSIDIKSLLENPSESKAQLQFSPAANIFVSGQLGFGAYAVETGLEVAGTFYTNTGANLTLEMTPSGLNFDIVPTVKEQYVVEVSHHVSTVTQETGREAVRVPVKFRSSQERETELCFDQVEFITGFTFCTHVLYTPSNITENAHWPLHGNNKLVVKLEMVDAIKFKGELVMSDPQTPSINLYYDTPKNGKQRQMVFKLLSSLKPEHLMGGFDLSVPMNPETPFKADASAGLVNKANEKKLYFHGHYSGASYEYEIGFKQNDNAIEPILKLNTDVAYIDGKIIVQETPNGVSYRLNQVKFGQPNNVMVVDGSVDVVGPKIAANLKFTQGANVVAVTGAVGYRRGQFNGDMQVASQQVAMANGQLNYELKFSDRLIGNDLVIVWDKDANSKDNRLEWNQYAEWDKENVKTKNKLALGKWNLGGRFNGEFSKSVINVDTGVEYQNQKAEFKLDNKYSQKVPHDYDTSIYAGVNQKSVKLDMKRDIEGESSKITNKLELSTGLRVELNGKIGHKFECTDADVSLQAVFVPGLKKESSKITIKLKNTQKDHTATGMVSVGKNDLASWESKLTFGNQMQGTMKASVKDILDADGTFKSNNGDGTAVIQTNLKDRKLKMDSKFTIRKPTFDFTTDIFYDYGNSDKKVHFSTLNNIQQNSVTSKNEVEVFNERYGFNVDASLEGTFINGKQQASAEIQLPTGRKLAATASREVKVEDKKGNGKMHFTATDELPNKQQRQVIVDVKMNDVNPTEKFFDFTGSMKYKNYENKDLKVQVALKNLKKGHYSTASVQMTTDGSLAPDVIQLNVKLDEYCQNHAIYSADGKYGTLGNIDLSGKFYVADKDRPHSHEFSGTLNLPNTKLQKLIVTSNGQLTEPAEPNSAYIVKYNGAVDFADQKLQVDTSLNMGMARGSGSVKLQLPGQQPISGEVKYNRDHQEDQHKADGTLTVNYGDNKKFEASGNIQRLGEKEVNVGVTLKSDIDQAKDVTLQFNAKRPSLKEVLAKIDLKADGQQYSVDYEHHLSETDPKFHLVVDRPQGVSKIHAEAQIASTLKGKGSIIVENVETFNLNADVDGDLSSIENFYLKGQIHSPSLSLNKFTFDVKSKDGAAGRTGFDFKITKDGQHLLSGSTDFTTKLDKGRTIVEGKSTIKLAEGKADEVKFKLIRNVFEGGRDGETGFGAILNIFVGARTFAGELKLTDKEFHAKYTGCETQNRCTNLETKSTLEKSSLQDFKHNLMVSVDLRQVGFSHEFGLKADTSRDGWKFQHSVDAYLQAQDKPDYQYSVFIQPTNAGALLILPKREIALDATYKYPERNVLGVYDGTVSFYIDKKNKPRQKTEIGFKGELSRPSQDVVSGRGDIKFQHPLVEPLRIGGEFTANVNGMDVKSKMEFDVFPNPMDKIVLSANFGNTDISGKGFNVTSDVELFSKGLGINLKYHEHAGLSYERRLISVGQELILPIDDFRFGVNAAITDKNFEVFVIGFGQEIVKSTASYDLAKQDMSIDGKLQPFGTEPFLMHGSITGLTQGEFTMNKGNLIKVNSGFAVGKDIHLLVIGSGKEVFNGKIALDQSHFLTTNYKVDDAQMKAFSAQLQEQIKNDLQSAEQQLKAKCTRVQEFWNQKSDQILKAGPDFTKFNEEYSQEVQRLISELKQDEALKKLIDRASNIIAEILKTFNNLTTMIGQQVQAVEKIMKEFLQQAISVFNEKVMPELKKMYESLQQLATEVYGQTVRMVTAAFERIAKALKSFEEDFNKISKAFKEITGNTYELIEQYIRDIKKELTDLCELLKSQIQTLPGVEFLKEKYDEIFVNFNLIEQAKLVIQELINSFVHVVPEQAKPFFQKFVQYIEKKFAGQEVDDIAVLKELYQALMQALQGFRKEYVDGISTHSITSPISIDSLKRLPPFITNIRLSALNQLRGDPIVNLRDLLYLYRPYAFDPAEVIPPFTMHGEMADGQHIFTFDGRHMTFPGTCSYILARDFFEGNFSIVANMANGKLKSISLTDKNGFLEVNNDGVLQLGGKNLEFPVHQKTLHAWRDYYTVSLLTEFGAEVQCTTDLTVCHFRVSGFYSGKTRGLLGNGNGEPYDDYMLPNGNIAESTTDLGNAYKTRQNCAQVTTSGDNHPKSHSNEFCSQYFGGDSSLRMCFIFVNPVNFREACEHATHGAADAQKAACNIAATYASRCRQEHLPVSIPKACSQCTVGTNKVDVGDEISVKVPQRQADVVVVFDIDLGDQLGMVQQVVQELRKELKNNGIPDVHIGAIGYGVDNKYVYQYTTNGKLDFKGNFANLKATGPKEEGVLVTGNGETDAAIRLIDQEEHRLLQDIGESADARAFKRAMRYPFRPTANKAILAIRSNGLPYSVNPSKLLNAELSGKITQKHGVGVHTIMPVSITSPAEKAKNIVGFNNNVAILINERKRPNMGSVDVYSQLKYQPDMGVDLTRKAGYVFNSNAYQTDTKKFPAAVGYVLADVISRTETKSDCKCRLQAGLYAETECIVTEQKFLPPQKKPARG